MSGAQILPPPTDHTIMSQLTPAQSAARYMIQHNWLRDGVAEEQVAAIIDRESNGEIAQLREQLALKQQVNLKLLDDAAIDLTLRAELAAKNAELVKWQQLNAEQFKASVVEAEERATLKARLVTKDEALGDAANALEAIANQLERVGDYRKDAPFFEGARSVAKIIRQS